MVSSLLNTVREKANNCGEISPEEALELLRLEGPDVYDLLAIANRLRHRHKGSRVKFCSIINAKSKLCGENCGFCSQAKNSNADVPQFPMIPAETIIAGAVAMENAGAHEFSIVTSGKTTQTKKELAAVIEALKGISKKTSLQRCASLGSISPDSLALLKEAGLQRVHHNLETSPNYYPRVCTTHTWESKLETIRTAKSLGIYVCSGGIFGIGESLQDRVDLAFILKELNVDSIPLNFFNPVPGTALAEKHNLTPMDCLKIIAVFRLIHPAKDIKVMGGREVNLRHLQSMIFLAGANGMLGGDYLTTKGRKFSEDIEMIHDLNLNCNNDI